MAVIDAKNMLSQLRVREAMRRVAVSIPKDATIEQIIRCSIKYKVNAILITDAKLDAVGVVSRTDLMTAYYAGIPIDTALCAIMRSPVVYCGLDDTLDTAIEVMRENRISRVYVDTREPARPIGVLSYPDIVGLLYRYCHKCEQSILRRSKLSSHDPPADVFKVREVMTHSVRTHDRDESLSEIMEGLAAAHPQGAVLIVDENGLPCGVVSRTDLILAYRRGVPASEKARTIMSSPVRSCSRDDELAKAIQTMIFCELQRLFVYRDRMQEVVGVLSLADAALARSGSCHACIPTRFGVEDD